jgi:hypothetical protein
MGQNLLLPQRNSNDRFTAITGHCRSNNVINSDQSRSRFIRDAQHTPDKPEVA